jgi:menaquinone-dependent protoporphyrinogen IX oxidase
MQKVLVTYITHSGTTRDVAEAIAEEITKTGHEAELLPLDQVQDTTNYSAMVFGAPMIIGWHKDALAYLKKHKTELSQKPLALFLTGMSLVDSPRPNLPGVEIHADPKFALPPQNPKRLNHKESFSTIKNYLAPVIKVAPQSLKAIGMFGGRLDYYRLKWWEVAFVMLVVGAKPGEKRNWPDIRAWAAGLPTQLKLD